MLQHKSLIKRKKHLLILLVDNNWIVYNPFFSYIIRLASIEGLIKANTFSSTDNNFFNTGRNEAMKKQDTSIET